MSWLANITWVVVKKISDIVLSLPWNYAIKYIKSAMSTMYLFRDRAYWGKTMICLIKYCQICTSSTAIMFKRKKYEFTLKSIRNLILTTHNLFFFSWLKSEIYYFHGNIKKFNCNLMLAYKLYRWNNYRFWITN